ncbi:MAG: amidohydrolase [Alphaproteobacteria bacterium]
MNPVRLFAAVLFAALVALAPASAPLAAEDSAALQKAVEKDYGYLKPLFEHFHRNPELSYLEHDTAKRLAAELRKAGAEVTEGVGGTGVVGVMKNGEGPTVLIRADMDGLPVEEKSGLPYASEATQKNLKGETVPVAHACGHDVHMTVLVGTARRLAALKDKWRGTVVLIGQPAEERIGGARRMLADGLYERFPRPDFALAMHVFSLAEAGKIILKPGLAYSSSDSVDIRVHGVGSHGASPHKGKDPVMIAAHLVVALQTLVAREIPPLEPGVVTVGAIHGGTKHNIIGEAVDLQLTVRSNNQEVRDQLIDGIKRISEGVGRTFGLPEDKLPTVKVSEESVPPTYNDPELTARIREAFIRDLGEDSLIDYKREGMGAEDFGLFTTTDPPVPGAYFNVGGTPKKALEADKAGGPAVAAHHSPYFKVAPEPSITAGVEAMTVAALELLEKP